MCTAALADKLIKKLHHGSDLDFDAFGFGLQDKYEKAMVVAMVMMESKTSGMEFIDDVLHGEW